MIRLTILTILSSVLLVSCGGNSSKRITVTNPSDLVRLSETIELNLNDMVIPEGKTAADLRVFNGEGDVLLSQLVDKDGDKNQDLIIFQCSFNGKGSQGFKVEVSDVEMPISEIATFGRYVPERHDDFAWENDLIAFRIYGPALQTMRENGVPGGGISSGVDCWLKRVEYPIVNKWYKKGVDGGSYHKDDGEGLDNYHVGSSAGCGGICVLDGDIRYASKNYLLHRTLSNGPIRSVFEFDYAAWNGNGEMMKETKRLSIDLGKRLTKWESKFYNKNIPQLGIGITLHDDVEADVKVNKEEGWASLWEPMGSSELGTAILVSPDKFEGEKRILSEAADESHIIIKSSVNAEQVLTYYAGYGWKKAGAITTPQEWESYLSNFAQGLQNPLIVEVK